MTSGKHTSLLCFLESDPSRDSINFQQLSNFLTLYTMDFFQTQEK